MRAEWSVSLMNFFLSFLSFFSFCAIHGTLPDSLCLEIEEKRKSIQKMRISTPLEGNLHTTWRKEDEKGVVEKVEGTLGVSVFRVYKASDTTTDMEVDRISRAEYLNISKKSTEAVPTQYYLLRGQSTPTLYLYPTPDAADTFKYWGLTKIQDAGDYEDELDVPTRFLPCLTAGMAYYVSLKKSPERTPLLKQLYEEEWQRASEEDRPRSSFYAIPERGVI